MIRTQMGTCNISEIIAVQGKPYAIPSPNSKSATCYKIILFTSKDLKKNCMLFNLQVSHMTLTLKP
jgi:hypothetical protein